jgi:glutathione S-transferase
VVTLYQAEWCPFSSAVREVLTELGIDFVARQVEPWPKERTELQGMAGTDQIPVLQTEDGRLYRGTREIFAHLHERDPWRFDAAHRRRFAAHLDARESDAPGQLFEFFRGTGELEAAAGSVEEAEVVDVPERSRYELSPSRTPRWTNPALGRGFGSRLAATALEDARRQGLDVAPLCPFIARYIERHPEYSEPVRD